MSKALKLKTILPTCLGTILEWAEYTFFAYMADQLSQHFFPIDDPDLARLKTYGIFATSYFMRPLGSLVFGALGDKKGRKQALVSSMLLMCFSTAAIGLLPGYKDIGISAPLLLIVCRLFQGLAVAGEFNGSAIFMYEHNKTRPFLAGSFTPFSAALGMSIGALASFLVSLPNAPVYAWRLPFIASGVIALIALYLRKQVPETPVFQQSIANTYFRNKTTSFFSSISTNHIGIISTISLSIFISVYVYTGNVYYKILCMKYGGLTPHISAFIVTFGQVSTALLTLYFGYLADKINAKNLCLIGLGGAVVFGPLIIWLGQSGNVYQSILGQILYSIMNGLISGTMMTLTLQKFEPNFRYRGNSVAWSIPAAILGGTALFMAESLVKRFGYMGPGLYISGTALLAFLIIAIFIKFNPKD